MTEDEFRRAAAPGLWRWIEAAETALDAGLALGAPTEEAERDRCRLERADVLALLDGQPDGVCRDRATLALARAGLLGIGTGLRELFAAGAGA